MPKTTVADEGFLANAPERYVREFAIPRPAGEVWAGLVADDLLAWCRPLSITWTCDRPFALGATREAKVLGALKARERFFVWEEGRRQAFSVEEVNIPVFKCLAEDDVVEPDGPDACRLTWRVAIEPTALGKPGRPLNALLFNSLFRDTRRHFDAT